MTWVASFFQVLRKKSEATILQPEIKVTRLWGAGDATQNGWIFGKVLKGVGGAIFNPKIYVAGFAPLNRPFFGRFPKKNCNIFFLKMRGGGHMLFGNFLKNHPFWSRHPSLRMTGLLTLSWATLLCDHQWFNWLHNIFIKRRSYHCLALYSQSVTHSCSDFSVEILAVEDIDLAQVDDQKKVLTAA